MKAVRRKDTAPEMLVRHILHRAGFRYRLHVAALPGSPDIVFPARRKVIFVHGCFWHGHECSAGRPPQTRQEYWLPKIARNRARDASNLEALLTLGWNSMVVWECALKDRNALFQRLRDFLN
jgi:DNA mismatch endonuclease (patch repair protein)